MQLATQHLTQQTVKQVFTHWSSATALLLFQFLMKYIELISISFFIIFTIACIFHQIFKFRNTVKKYDYLKILPVWTFFSPNPIQHDYHLLFRDRVEDSVLQWKQVNFIKKKNIVSPIWHPERRLKKKLIAISNLFNKEIRNYKREKGEIPKAKDLVNIAAYQICLEIAMKQPTSSNEYTHRQFMIAKTNGTHIPSKPEIFIISLYHRIPKND
jgi:hypothetical protein